MPRSHWNSKWWTNRSAYAQFCSSILFLNSILLWKNALQLNRTYTDPEVEVKWTFFAATYETISSYITAALFPSSTFILQTIPSKSTGTCTNKPVLKLDAEKCNRPCMISRVSILVDARTSRGDDEFSFSSRNFPRYRGAGCIETRLAYVQLSLEGKNVTELWNAAQISRLREDCCIHVTRLQVWKFPSTLNFDFTQDHVRHIIGGEA